MAETAREKAARQIAENQARMRVNAVKNLEKSYQDTYGKPPSKARIEHLTKAGSFGKGSTVAQVTAASNALKKSGNNVTKAVGLLDAGDEDEDRDDDSGDKVKKTTKTTAAGDDTHKDLNISKARYDYRPDVVVGGKNVFHGTNIPTTGFSPEDIARYNATLKADIDNKDWYGANDTLFSIAHAQGGGQGNPRVGALQSGMWRVTADPKATLWAEQNLNSANDQYILRDDKGVPTGVVLGYDENLGIVRGTPKKGQETTWKSIGSWGENARAGIVEGRPTNAPQAGLTTTSIYNPDRPGYDQFTGDVVDYAGPAGGSGIGTAVGGLMATTPYTQPAPQDWSALRYTYAGSPQSELGQVTQTPASRAMFGDKGAAMQPWATGQQVPAGLLNYQIPGGAPVNVGYSNPLGLFDYNNQQNVTNQNNVVTNPLATNPSAWSNYDPVTKKTTTDFATWQQAQHDALYPGRQAAANKAGVGGWKAFTPAGRKWTAEQPNTSAAWIAAQNGLLVAPKATATTPVIGPTAGGLISQQTTK